MKTIILAVCLMLACQYSGYAQANVYITTRPAYRPVGRPPMAPTRGYVWIGEEWAWRGGSYVPVGNQWVRPPYPRAVWIPGRWMHYRRGWHWVPGHWRR